MADPTLKTWKVADTISENVTREQFLKAIDIWNTNPRSVNQRIHSSIVVLRGSLSGRIDTIDLSLKLASFKSEVIAFDTNQFQDALRTLGLNFSLDETGSSEVYLKKLLPKSNKHFSVSFELVIIGNISSHCLPKPWTLLLFHNFFIQTGTIVGHILVVSLFKWDLAFSRNSHID